jgi:hypothetical protein
VNAQLIDAESGAHLWAERFDKPRADYFNMQDEITARLARAMDVGLVAIEAQRAKHERLSDLDAIDLALRGWNIYFQSASVRAAREARSIFEQALRIDDKNVDVLIGLVETHMWEVNSYMSNARAEQVRLAEAAMSRVLELTPNSTRAHFTRASMLMALGDLHRHTPKSSSPSAWILIGEHTIEYCVFDQNGHHGRTTRTLNVITTIKKQLAISRNITP